MTMNSENISFKKIAVCGEQSSGKTSVINSIYRSASVPDFNDVRNKPLIRVLFGDVEDAIRFTDIAGKATTVVSAEAIPTDGSIWEIEISTQDSPFGACEVIEFPPLRDGHVTQEEIDRISACDALVWTTIGSQSWRLSEKTIFDELQKTRRMPAVLVVSRADKFRSADDERRLNTRLDKETANRFDARVMMRADPKLLDAARHDEDAWEQAGGKNLADSLLLLAQRAPEQIVAPKAQSMAEMPSNTHEESNDDKVQPRPRSRIARPKSRGGNTVAKLLKRRTFENPSKAIEPEETPVAAAVDETANEVATNPIETADEELVDTNTTETSSAEDQTTFEPLVLQEELAVKTDDDQDEPCDVQEDEPRDTQEEVREIAEGLDGFLSLSKSKHDFPEDIILISGDAEHANQLADHLADAKALLTDSAFFEDPEWVHITLKNHQILYRLGTEKNDGLAMACHSSNAGVARNAFMRISKIMTENP